ncbi:MAG TPA: enoyl-CoA hydratase [Streptosporangiaceae bacterium]|jgi:enoyl-CoA hydratase/carnithine racemase|nr:enoyl-CoA hydratase [Streptosporangiaceae bacterium]
MIPDTPASDLATGTERLLLRVGDQVAQLTFNNPAKRNALSLDMARALPDILRRLERDPGVRVILITGSGDRAFMSGADISEFGQLRTSVDDRAEYDRASIEMDEAWAALTKPVVAMIRGYCIGRGMLTALQADIRLCSRDATFAIPAARLGLGYGFSGVRALSHVVGPTAAAYMLFTGQRLTAAEALRAGLVNEVTEPENLAARAHELAAAIAANAPLTIAACKAALRELRKAEADQRTDVVREMVERCDKSADYLEGQAAFKEKRPPRFEGR